MVRKLLDIFFGKKRYAKLSKDVVVNRKKEHRTFTENGGFIKAEEFELLWVKKNVNDNYRATDYLDDYDFLDYKLWEDINAIDLYKKHLPNTYLCRGVNPNIIFHGGCLGCLSQRLFGLERCMECAYFRFDFGKNNLHIKGEDADKISSDDLKNILGLD